MIQNILPVLLPLLIGLTLPLVILRPFRLRSAGLIITALTSLTLSLAALITVLVKGPLVYFPGTPAPPAGTVLQLDIFSALALLAFTALLLFVTRRSGPELDKLIRTAGARLPVFWLTASLAALTAILSLDLLTIYLALLILVLAMVSLLTCADLPWNAVRFLLDCAPGMLSLAALLICLHSITGSLNLPAAAVWCQTSASPVPLTALTSLTLVSFLLPVYVLGRLIQKLMPESRKTDVFPRLLLLPFVLPYVFLLLRFVFSIYLPVLSLY